ncbi:peptidoglycan DD-metalloendopeptidase family protein [Pseudohongiella sp.]|uniref:LysM domain-containing protein n=1 Tax=marine sediment metagenome TaxID=412755 RepID=A0A0F9YI52_9ZZZZ|nr:peptidoglycan DD-metalloendopeptidase family protein [Pseudohongiella sp.]HDZ08519.1 LysM peptidoglycan-binding domain-containing protein [Pseudohongiella sp.]HEA61743.1 LysM peptidoglycan-binding domain-containing protein [Pseudohongiella sp.]
MSLFHRAISKIEHKPGTRFRQRMPLAAACVLLLAGCASDYQAPMDDRSSALERTPPVIVSNGQEVPATPRRRPEVTSSDSNASNSESVGASTTVVRPVTVAGGIGRTTISRSTLPADAQPDASQQQSTAVPPATAAPQQSASAAPGSHTVARGDTLYSIAWTHNIDYRRLALVNNLSAPYTIYPGQRLNLADSGVSESAISALPDIPASPAGELATTTGQRPQAAIDARRTGSVNTRQVEGVSWQWPADGRMLSMFSESGANRGVDIAGMQGQAVFAAADGDVVYAGSGIQGAGNLVILRHSARHLSAYMYNRTMVVGEGDRVRAGDKIAEMGSGPNGRDMLHFEVRVDGKPTDPVRFLPSR